MTKAEIKRLLKQAGVKQKDIAKVVGVTPQFVNQVIAGKRDTYSIIKAISEAVNRPISEVWPEG